MNDYVLLELAAGPSWQSVAQREKCRDSCRMRGESVTLYDQLPTVTSPRPKPGVSNSANASTPTRKPRLPSNPIPPAFHGLQRKPGSPS